MRSVLVALTLLLAGCDWRDRGMTDEEILEVDAQCRASGRNSTGLMYADGRITEMRCGR